ncbi:MAG: PQQ-binding-like beta-propeller repeat protein [Bryobacteraceae bacterium]|nr:PQQ-binding-like beta-propeller repeat protein [Bryobacteraceae bacterium]
MRILLLFFSILILEAEDWPQFRGPGGQGHSSETGLPVEWSEAANVKWKVAIPGQGWSSPSIQGDRIWLTTATEAGKSLRLLALDKASGETRLDVEVFRLEEAGQIHAKNSPASPTPLIGGNRVWVHFGAFGTAALTTEGEILWKKQLPYAHQHGPGNSPVLAAGLLYVNCDGTDQQYAVALDPETGEVRWKKDRPSAMAFATPLVVPHGDREIIISPGAKRSVTYDAKTGEELWSVRYGDGFSNVPRPVVGHGLAFIATGFYKPEILAVKMDGKGDVTESHVLWRTQRGTPHTPSPLLVGDEIYFVSDTGVATCADARTGKVHWTQRLGGNHSASPVFADGRIYFLSEEGETVVLLPGTKFEVLARNQLDGRFLASIAPSDRALFLRSDTHVFRIEAPK